MFENVGSKIKKLAKVFFFIGCIVGTVGGIATIVAGATGYRMQFLIAVGVLVIPLGILLAWLSNLGLYAFGQLVENSDIRTEIMAEQAYSAMEQTKQAVAPAEPDTQGGQKDNFFE